MERQGRKVIFLDEAKGADAVFAKRALVTDSGKVRSGAFGYDANTGQWTAVFPSRTGTSATALFEEQTHYAQQLRGVLGAEREITLGPDGPTIRLIGKEASELDVAVQMYRAVERGDPLVTQGDLSRRIRSLVDVDLRRLNLTEAQVEEIVKRYGSQQGPFLK
jgi:hypothetical protein